MSAPVEVLAVMDAAVSVDPVNENFNMLAARAAVAEQQTILRRLVAWNHNVNGDGAELAELLALAEAQVGRGDATGERRHGIERIPAVAELIEAADEASVSLGESMEHTHQLVAHMRLCAALARVQGGAA